MADEGLEDLLSELLGGGQQVGAIRGGCKGMGRGCGSASGGRGGRLRRCIAHAPRTN